MYVGSHILLCIYVCVYVCMFEFMYVDTWIRLNVCIYVDGHMQISTYVWMYMGRHMLIGRFYIDLKVYWC